MSTETSSRELADAPLDAEPPGVRSRRHWARALPWLATLAVIALWQLGAVTRILPAEVPSVTAIGRALAELVPTARFVTALGATLSQFAVGLLIGTMAGIALGVAVGAVPLLYRLTHYVFDFLRFIPAVVYLPLMLLVFGAAPRVSTLLGAVGALWAAVFRQPLRPHRVAGLHRPALRKGSVTRTDLAPIGARRLASPGTGYVRRKTG